MREKYKAKDLDGCWVEGYFVEQYHSSKKIRRIDAIFWSDMFRTYRTEIYTNTLTRWLPISGQNVDGIWLDFDVFEFDFVMDGYGETRIIKLRGVMNFDTEELRYQINVYSPKFPQFICLYFNSTNMSNFKIIGNIHDNPELLKSKEE